MANHDLVLRGGRVIDGTGAAAVGADVAIDRDRSRRWSMCRAAAAGARSMRQGSWRRCVLPTATQCALPLRRESVAKSLAANLSFLSSDARRLYSAMKSLGV